MRRTLTGILAAAICMTLTACGAQGDAYEPRPTPASRALIYIYRPYKILSSQTDPMVTCGHESIELEAGGFYEFEDDAGEMTCAIATEANSNFKFDAHAGERYFIKEEVEAGGLTTHARLIMMNADVGGDEIRECSRQGIDH